MARPKYGHPIGLFLHPHQRHMSGHLYAGSGRTGRNIHQNLVRLGRTHSRDAESALGSAVAVLQFCLRLVDVSYGMRYNLRHEAEKTP